MGWSQACLVHCSHMENLPVTQLVVSSCCSSVIALLPRMMFMIPHFWISKNILAEDKDLLRFYFPLNHPLAVIRILSLITVSSLCSQTTPRGREVFWNLICYRLNMINHFLDMQLHWAFISRMLWSVLDPVEPQGLWSWELTKVRFNKTHE